MKVKIISRSILLRDKPIKFGEVDTNIENVYIPFRVLRNQKFVIKLLQDKFPARQILRYEVL